MPEELSLPLQIVGGNNKALTSLSLWGQGYNTV